VHPGLVDTQLAGRSGKNFANWNGEKFFKLLGAYVGLDDGSYTNLFTIASKDFKPEQSGEYFVRVAKTRKESMMAWETGQAKDLKLAERLDKWTREKMTQEGWVKTT
jgi:hypothetical protein